MDVRPFIPSQSGAKSGWSIGLPSGRSGQTAATHGSFLSRFTSLTAHLTSPPGTRTMLLSRLWLAIGGNVIVVRAI